MAGKDLLSRLADAGEEAISKLGDTPGSDKLLGLAHNMRERMEEMQKKLRGIDELEKRVAALERQLAEQKVGTTTRKRASTSSARKTSTAKSRAKPTSGATEASRSRAASTPRSGSGGSSDRTGGSSPG
jgi:hypothetical protein